MGFFSDMFGSLEKQGLEMKYGIKRPDDALRVVERIINSHRDDEDKAHNLRPIIGWLNKLDMSGRSSEATYVLERIRKQYGSKLRSIEVRI